MRPKNAVLSYLATKIFLLSFFFLSFILTGCERSFLNPSDPDASRFTEKSQAFLLRAGDTDPVEGDTVRFFGGVTSVPVEADQLITRYAWDLDGDGRVDSTQPGTDSMAWVFSDPGQHQVGLTLTDRAGFTSSASVDFRVQPSLSRLFRLQGYASDCPAYAQEPVFMRIALAVSQFTVEQTKEEGIGATDFALKLARALTGSAFPINLLDGFDYTFSRGVYHFRNGTFSLDIAFHYGPGLSGHAEGDTLMANLFDLGSYITGIKTTLWPPSLKYSKGPLAELIDGNIDFDISDIENPKFDFKVDFNRVRFSFHRETKLPLILSNQEITLVNALFFTLYEGRATMAPLYPLDLIRLYGRDSLELDFAGTKVSSPELPLAWEYTENGVKDTAVYRLVLVQETLRQNYRFGDAGGVKKVFGEYAAINRLGERDGLEAVYFQGGYSSVEADSARFYCQETMEDKDLFGVAALETSTLERGRFNSQRYDYGFSFPFSTVEPWNAVK